MSNFLDSLVSRSLGAADALQPRLPARFETPKGDPAPAEAIAEAEAPQEPLRPRPAGEPAEPQAPRPAQSPAREAAPQPEPAPRPAPAPPSPTPAARAPRAEDEPAPRTASPAQEPAPAIQPLARREWPPEPPRETLAAEPIPALRPAPREPEARAELRTVLIEREVREAHTISRERTVIERAALREGARPADARSEPARAERQGAPVRPEVVRVREPAAAWQPEERAEATPEPPVVVSIGRIDVRVHTTPAAPRQRAQQRGMTLEEYLRKRSRGDD